MENENVGHECCHGKHKGAFMILGIVLLAAIVIVSIIRDRIVNNDHNQVTVYGQGKVAYQPDEATITLGMQADKVPTAEQALAQINEKIGRVIAAVKQVGIEEKDIETQTYSLNPHYDYVEGVSSVSGYDASQNLVIKVKGLDEKGDMSSKVIAAATGAGANKVIGVSFAVSNLSELKQQARIAAIKDARAKSGDLIKASGVKVGKVMGWYENFIQSPDTQASYGGYGMGGSDSLSSAKAAPIPQVPSGTQEIIVEVGVNYEVK